MKTRAQNQDPAKNSKKTHGGKRANSGRKNLGKVRLLAQVLPELKARVKSEADKRGVDQSDIVVESLEQTLPPVKKKSRQPP